MPWLPLALLALCTGISVASAVVTTCMVMQYWRLAPGVRYYVAWLERRVEQLEAEVAGMEDPTP